MGEPMNDYLQPVNDNLPMRSSGRWAEEKLDYLKRYIDVFETSMREKWERRNYIDILSGPGKNQLRETGKVLLGSPLLALTTRYPFTGYYFVDIEPDNIATLETRFAASELKSQVKTYTGDCNLLVDSIVADLQKEGRSSLNLAFLDPEGLELHWRTVMRLASIRRMDLIINYPRGGLSRTIPLFLDAEDETPIDRFFGGREWRDVVRQSPTRIQHRQLLDIYKGKLLGLGYQEIKNSDELGEEPLTRNKKQAPLYHLIFASKSSLGHKFWNQITKRDVHGQRRLFD
jgi:three-Cys-motif partner protein